MSAGRIPPGLRLRPKPTETTVTKSAIPDRDEEQVVHHAELDRQRCRRGHQQGLERAGKLLLTHNGRDPRERDLDEETERHANDDELQVADVGAAE